MIGKNVPFVALWAALMSCCVGPPVQSRAVAVGVSLEKVVTREQWMNGLTVAVGDKFRIPKPAANEQWTVTYARDIVRLLSAADRLEHPDPEGWRFEAIARGSGEMTFTGFVPPGRGDQPNPPKFVLQVSVR